MYKLLLMALLARRIALVSVVSVAWRCDDDRCQRRHAGFSREMESNSRRLVRT